MIYRRASLDAAPAVEVRVVNSGAQTITVDETPLRGYELMNDYGLVLPL